jgi:hypothetical protein
MNEEVLLKIKTTEIMELYLPWLECTARREAFNVLRIKRFEVFSAAEICALPTPRTVEIEMEASYRRGYRHGYIDSINAIPSKNLSAKVLTFFESKILPWSHTTNSNLVPPPTFKKK